MSESSRAARNDDRLDREAFNDCPDASPGASRASQHPRLHGLATRSSSTLDAIARSEETHGGGDPARPPNPARPSNLSYFS